MLSSKQKSVDKIRPRCKNERILNTLAKKANAGDLAAKSRLLNLIKSNPVAVNITAKLTQKYDLQPQ